MDQLITCCARKLEKKEKLPVFSLPIPYVGKLKPMLFDEKSGFYEVGLTSLFHAPGEKPEFYKISLTTLFNSPAAILEDRRFSWKDPSVDLGVQNSAYAEFDYFMDQAEVQKLASALSR